MRDTCGPSAKEQTYECFMCLRKFRSCVFLIIIKTNYTSKLSAIMTMSTTSYQMTPFYAPSGDDRTQYNPHQYYNNYAFAPSQAPPHPDRSVAYGQSGNGNNAFGFASPPAPTLQDVYAEFGTAPSTSPLGSTQTASFDLLDDSAPPPPSAQQQQHNDLQTAAFLAAQQQQSSSLTASSRAIVTTDDIPSEIIASQERALAEAKRLQQQRRAGTSASSSSTAMVTVPEIAVPESHNPTGSDAVHPNRPVWKQTRGAKTVAGAAAGSIVGGLMFGPAFPVGMVLGGAAGGYATNKLSKQGERRAQRKWEQSSFQAGAQRSLTAKSEATMV